MNYQWRPPRSRINNVDSPPNISPLTIGNRFENAVPPGTVASRLRFLQSLANTDSTRPAPIFPSRHRETSRTGYGRRMTNRFGVPACRNVNPDEQPTVENSHTFLGLNSPRINHSEEHAIADHRARFDRNAEINDQTKPRELRETLQYDAGTLRSKIQSQRSVRREYSGHEMDVLKEVDSSGSQRHFTAQTSIFPGPANEDSENRDTYRREIKSRNFDTERSDASAVTTSTIRRQSVRDLFYHYNIERPAGLASSSEDASHGPEHTLRPTRPHRYCHVCSWVNSGSQNKCWRCEHRLCPECDALSPLRNMCKEAGLDYVEKVPNSKIPVPISQPKPLKMREQEPVDLTLVRPGPSPIQKPRGELPRDRNHSSQTIKFPSFHEEGTSKRKKSKKSPAQSIKIPEQRKLLHIQSTSRINTNVKESPFVIADQILCGGQSIRVLPVPISVRISSHQSYHSRPVHENEDHHHGSGQPPSPSSDAGDCDSPTCRATHHGHAPFRHSVTCTRKKRRVEDTDNGYVADTSHVEDASYSKDHSHSQYSYVSRPGSRAAHLSRLSSKPCSNLSRAKELGATDHREVPEYVECRGYPRTGHARHGSPTASGVVGECQHCLDDCQCAACQSTHHNVRCCVHEDHHAVIHHHHTPRRITNEEPNPLELPPSLAGSPDQTATPAAHSPARTVSTVIPSRTHCRTSTPPILRESPSPIAPLQLSPGKATLRRKATLSTSKSSTFKKKEAPRPPTPPPWVSMPKVRKKTAVVEPGEQISRRGTTDTAFDIIADPEPPPPFKEKPTLPPPATCDESSPEMSGVPTDGTRVTIHSDDDLEHDQARRESRILLSRKDSALNQAMSPSVGIPSRTQDPDVTRSEARASRRISSMFKLRETTTVPLLNQKLQEHQEELRRIEKECDERLEVIARGGGKGGPTDLIKETGTVEKRVEELERKPSVASWKGDCTEKKKRWKLRLVDPKPSPKCQNDKTVEMEEHRLSDDEIVDSENDCKEENRRDEVEEKHLFSDHQVVKEEGNVSNKIAPGLQRQEEIHECAWKTMALEGQFGQKEPQNGRMGIKGITLLIHLEGREDLVIKADLSDAGRQGAPNS